MITFENLPEAVFNLQETVTEIKRLLLGLNHSPQPKPEELLTVQGAASYLSISVATIYSKISKGELPVMKRGKRCYFSKVELIDYLKEGRKKTSAEMEQEADKHLEKLGQKKLLTPNKKL